MNAWDNLSLTEKSEMMRVAIENGITTLPEIKEAYNQFALGGPEDKNKSILKTVQEKEAAFNEKLVKPIEIGYDKDRAFTLTNAGSLTGAHLSEEMTDYIIQEAEKAGVDLQTAFGIAAAESTLGNPTDDKSAWNISSGIRQAFNNTYPGTAQHINTYGDVVNEQELLNFYYPLENQNPYTQQIAEAERQARKGKDFEQTLIDGMRYADRQAQKPVPTGSVAQQAFEYFKQNGEGYAPGYKEQTGQSYVQHVKKKGKEALQSPEIQKAITNYTLKKIGRPKEYSFGTIDVEPLEWRQKAYGGNLFSGEEGHSSQMHQEYVYDVLPKMLKEAGLNVRVTSGYRRPGQAGKAGSRSWHTHHGAVDIVPQGKTTFEDIENALYNNPVISRYMIDNGFGLIDESGRTAESKATMKKTGATGAHFHIGKDSKAVSAYNNKMSSIWDSNMGQLETAINQPALPAFMPSNPQAFFAPLESYQRPVVVEEPLVQAAMESAYSPEQIEREERAQGLRNLGLAMSIMRGNENYGNSSLWDTVGLLTGNQFKSGGKIHIKPENRGKFTALKKRTGHSATWFKEHGTPAQKKMATFALNARKWKHGLGGNLFSGEDEPTQQMQNGLNLYRRTNNLGETEYIYQETPDSEEILLTPTNKRFSDDPTNWDYKDASGREYSPRMTTTYNPGELREDIRGPLERMVDNYFGELKYQANNNVPISGKYTMPAIAATPFLAWAGEAAYPYVSTVLANPYVDAGLTSAFAGHGLNHAINEGIDGWGDAAITAMELAPLGRLARPMYNAGIDAAASGRRFILDVGDRYQGMKDAAAYRDANGIKDARAIANTKWLESYEKPAGINRMGVNNDGSFGIYYPDNSEAGHWYSPVIEKGGKMTLTTHLGGDIPGEYSKDLLPMSKSEIAATIKYLRGVPEHTYFGEVGKTKNYAEQYFNENPSRIRAFRDAIHGKKEINEPYWNEEEHITDFMNETDPIEQAYYRHLYEANEPLSIDSYKLILQEAAKNNGKFALRYDSSPMGMFNPQGFYEEEFYNSLQSLTPKEQVKAINDWMRSYYPKARPAYLKNGEVMIPRPLLMLRSSK